MGMNKKVLIGVPLVLFLIAASFIVFLTYSSGKNATLAPTPTSPPYNVQRSDEIPYSTHRAVSLAPSRVSTTLTPWGIAMDKTRGFIWVAEPGCEPKPTCPSRFQGVLGEYALSDGSFITNFYEPSGYTSPMFVAVDGSGNVWFTQPNSDAIGEFDPQHQTWHQWSTKKGSAPFDLVFDKQGNLWFTEYTGNSIGFLNARTHTLVETPTPGAGSSPYGIALDTQGNIWFAENALGIDKIGSFAPSADGHIRISEHDVTPERPHLITADGAGNIWYTGGFDGRIGVFNSHTGQSTVFQVFRGACLTPPNCTGTHISGISVDNRGYVWYTDSLTQQVGYLIPSSGQVVARTLPASNAHPYDGLLVDDEGRVWFTEEFKLTLTMWPTSSVR
jgi:virginiamycin B lyase